MKLAIISDTHFEFDDERPGQLLDQLEETKPDILVLAGDVCVPAINLHIADFWSKLPVPTIYVPGNHEYFSAYRQPQPTHVTLAALAKIGEQPNVHLLRRGAVTVLDRRFVGATLWYPRTHTAERYKDRWPDFTETCDPRGEFWQCEEAGEDAAFIAEHTDDTTIVVTHMLPSPQCVAPRWRESGTNNLFVHDMTAIIRTKSPPLWIHGHTHDARDIWVGQTHILCNPWGYPHEHLRGELLVVEV